MSTNFKGKVIAITGAASGIGLAASKMLASRGAIVAMSDFNEKLLNESASELKSSGATVTATGESQTVFHFWERQYLHEMQCSM